MSAAALLAELRAAGVTLAATGDRLKVEAATGTITSELLARLKAFKPELLAFLSGEPIDTEPAPDLPLLAALAEFDALIDRLCELSKHSPEVREEMRRVQYGVAACNVPREIEVVRELVKRAEAGDAALADDRITCRDCANRRTYDGACKVAEVGAMVNAMRGYVPDATLPHRCAGFLPKANAEDKRTGAERWSNLDAI